MILPAFGKINPSDEYDITPAFFIPLHCIINYVLRSSMGGKLGRYAGKL